MKSNRRLVLTTLKRITAITPEESQKFIERYKRKMTQRDLQNFVDEEALDTEAVNELMYDLEKAGIFHLSKPKAVGDDVEKFEVLKVHRNNALDLRSVKDDEKISVWLDRESTTVSEGDYLTGIIDAHDTHDDIFVLKDWKIVDQPGRV